MNKHTKNVKSWHDKKLTFVIGDVHGEYGSLKLLVNKLPKNSDLIFVGDLVDRGRKSKEVIEFVKSNNYKCVLGNHEEMMIEQCEKFIKNYPNIHFMDTITMWMRNGGKQTLLSYGLIEIDKHDGKINIIEDKEKFEVLKEHISWLKTLPLYIELDIKRNKKPVVVSHSAIGNVWHFRNDEKNKRVFEEWALWGRKMPNKDSEIFNIFGHTIVQKVDIQEHYVNVDTGCNYTKDGFGVLSAYCIENKEVITQS